ncbi:hypothetical protein [Thermoactinomyces mirandus]|uniref:Uncharacterized protein n=1 Tax=Thermoactinomyces mirandus TaxID=2756294 RepID=A0A7W2AR38_9BACL|nr:hypothetical protein [Thermoactinomyces mirandus]MBA4602584.1 hypothetical protein [Thermoactinomyces mirandus]
MKWMQSSLTQAIAGTLAITIILLASLWLGKSTVPVDHAVPSVAKPSDSSLRTEYVMEKVGSKKVQPVLSSPTDSDGYWIVERYRQYEYYYDTNGRFLYKNPTQHETYLRYWHHP